MRTFERRVMPQRPSGSILLVALVLLLLAGLLTVIALKAGVIEQRSTGNDVRAKVVGEVAEAGLAQGFEYLTRQHAAMLKNAALWERCAANDNTFPCGAVSAATFDDDGDPDTAPVSRRAQMFRLRADTTNVITGIDSALSRYMLPMPASSKIASMANGAVVSYGVAPVVCFATRPANAGATGIPCGNVGASSTSIATFVSVARMQGENASSTLVQTVGQYPKIGDDLLTKPPITTSGSSDVTGGLEIVTNPNAGGPGVPVSVWTRHDVDKHGTPNTCYADEFFRYTQGNHTPTVYQSTIRCDDCKCDANGAPKTLSFDTSGVNRCTGPSSDCEGIDVLDVETGTNSTTGYNTGGHTGTNYNVRSDAQSFPTCEFPPDMFRYVFGVQAWTDTDNDCFAETKAASVVYQNPDNATAIATVGPDEAYLYKIADHIIAKASNVPLLKVGQQATSAMLSDENSSGVIWCQAGAPGGCDIPNGQVGTPNAPVLLILDGPVQIHGVIFGFVFIRETASTLNPVTGSSLSGNCPSNCMLQMNAGSAIYGALVLQGQMKVNGTAAVIYDGTVLRGVIDEAGLVYATLPGAWSDQRSY
ncbi:hypothetical protein LYSHEL_06610 [Lysobacter helvus]|uniref:Type 4 fimbrial biogenesis protein PilX N-terminal domain-containing protein n=2 Tax=Lysobacteraceae TaxID=32033 RepID=A0ABM7Q2Z8_9GAMM|nr:MULTISPECIES: hypothetical protein [Lysobacter]BCT91637.1 hypothetical protein LYSCAS_06610 [Lysobacter caseinilyticus]BCT94790.1 hypothetical protein LYSHEL_06610 [Lysobacter helvus]